MARRSRGQGTEGAGAQLHEVPAESVLLITASAIISRDGCGENRVCIGSKLRPRKVSDFADWKPEARPDRIDLRSTGAEQSEVLIGDFQAATFKAEGTFLRMGGGSLGGKARGLAFVRHLLYIRTVYAASSRE